jgi:hypothetical protein
MIFINFINIIYIVNAETIIKTMLKADIDINDINDKKLVAR